MHIVARKREFLQSLAPFIPSKVSKLFAFGYDTLVGHKIVSTRANARRSPHLWNTAKSKMHRCLKNSSIASLFPTLLIPFSIVSAETIVAVDFSDFGHGRQVLMFARQTRKGRAIPLYFEILEYPIEKDSQNLFVIAAIKRFFLAAGCTPPLVFDRGFACPSIVDFLAQHEYRFIIRIKKWKFVRSSGTGEMRAADEIEGNDCLVHAYEHDLRLTRSDDPRNGNDPWYLITNDTESTRSDIIARYYHRFEIEEFFRDAKRLIGLEWIRCKTTRSLTILLWFALLTTWLFERLAETLSADERCEQAAWHVSVFRYMFEKLQHEYLCPPDPMTIPTVSFFSI